MTPDCPDCKSAEAVEEWGESGEFWFHCHECERDFESPLDLSTLSVTYKGKKYTDGEELIRDAVSAEVDKLAKTYDPADVVLKFDGKEIKGVPSVQVSRHPRGGSWTGAEGEEFCHKCNRDTKWVPMRKGSKRVKCEGCGDVYPCRSKCDHLDCIEDKERMNL